MPNLAPKPQRVPVPQFNGLDNLTHNIQAISAAAEGLKRSESTVAYHRASPGKLDSSSNLKRSVSSPAKSPGIPKRKPLPPNMMQVPVYDNGTTASYNEAQKLKKSSMQHRVDSGYTSSSHTMNTQSTMSSGSIHTPANSKVAYASGPNPVNRGNLHNTPPSQTQGRTKPIKRPAPLNLATTKQVYAPGVVQSYADRPLPSTPFILPHSGRIVRPSVQKKIPAVPSIASSTTIGKPGSRKSTVERSKAKAQNAALRHEDAVRLHNERQASQIRVLKAKQTVEKSGWSNFWNGEWHELERLTRDERSQVNEHIKRKRDDERRTKQEEERQRIEARARANAASSEPRRKREWCVVM